MTTFGVIFLAALSVGAHQVGLSRGVWAQNGADVDVEIVFSAQETGAPSALAPLVVSQTKVNTDGVACAGTLAGESAAEEDGHAVRVHFACGRAGRVTVELSPLLMQLPPGHRHLGRVVSANGEHDVVVFLGAPSFSFGQEASPMAFLWIGVEHILLGFDHLLFLLGVIVIPARLRALLGIITAFTVAHSVTLALAVLDVWAPPNAVTEPLIALSIAYVGVENLFVRDGNRRWRVTAAFGLIHGFGFAGALAEIGIPAGKSLPVLFLFNFGVELGQLAVLAVIVPILIALRARGMLGVKTTRAVSLVVMGLGVLWLVERLRGGA